MSTAFHIHQNDFNAVCKNQDVIYDGVYLFTNQRGLHKRALMMPPASPVSWISLYGSLTISQIGKENPNGGINEAGLVVEQTTLWQSQYPAVDERPALNELHFIQYLLDTCRSVEEALIAAPTVRIDQSTSKLHYLLADRSGNHAIVEFLDGEMIVHQGKLPIPVMTNTAYAYSVREIGRGIRDWADKDEYEQNSMDRFLTIAEALHALKEQVPDNESAFEMLADARREDTVFSLVYNLDQMELLAMTQRNQERITIRMDEFDFDYKAPGLAANLQKLQVNNPVAQFLTYSAGFNQEALTSFFRDPLLTSVFKWEISDDMIHFAATYPDSFL